MRRLTIALASSLVLVLAIAGTAFGWDKKLDIEPNCAPDANSFSWHIVVPDEPDAMVDWSFDSDFDTFTTKDFLSDGDYDFTTPRGGETIYVRWTNDHNGALQDSALANGELCEPEGEPSVDLDKFVWDEGGLVTEVTAGDPVTYTYEVTNDGETNLDIALLEDLIVSSPGADPGDVACDEFDQQNDNPGNDDSIFEPGETWVFTCTLEDGLPIGVTSNQACVYANVAAEVDVLTPVVDPRDSDVFSCAEYTITSHEGETGGGTGTPAASLPNSAVTSPAGAPMATLAFGLLLMSSLGALAFVNVRSSARRR